MNVNRSAYGSCDPAKMTYGPLRNVELAVCQGFVELKNGAFISKVKCQNDERNVLTGDIEYQGDCCYFTLMNPSERLRDHYCFNIYLGKVEYMHSDDFVVPQPVQPQETFIIDEVQYGLHIDNGFVEISKGGVSFKRIEAKNKEFAFFSGVTHVHNGCFYFLLSNEELYWQKPGIFNPTTNFFALSSRKIFNPHFKDDQLISVNPGDRYNYFVNVLYIYDLLTGEEKTILKKVEHRIGNRSVELKPYEMEPFL